MLGAGLPMLSLESEAYQRKKRSRFEKNVVDNEKKKKNYIKQLNFYFE